jgi:hypothetical protein
MKKTIRSGSFFAKAEGAPSWKDRLAKMTGKAKPKATAKLEIDDANGEKLLFPEISDVSEIAEGVAVTATDGEHVFTSDTTTYTVTVAAGVITAVVETPIEEEAPAAEAMGEETIAFVEAVAEAMEVAETFQATATAKFTKLESDLATALETIKTLKATMSHAAPAEGEGTDGNPKPFKVAGRTIDLSKINLK